MDSVYYCGRDEIDVFYIDIRIGKLSSLNVLCRSNGVGILWFSLIEGKKAIRLKGLRH
jgi:hypothetical protein